MVICRFIFSANGAVQPEPGFPAIGWDGWSALLYLHSADHETVFVCLQQSLG